MAAPDQMILLMVPACQASQRLRAPLRDRLPLAAGPRLKMGKVYRGKPPREGLSKAFTKAFDRRRTAGDAV